MRLKDRRRLRCSRCRKTRRFKPPSEVLPDGHIVAGVSTLVDASGKLKQQWIKTKSERERYAEWVARTLEELPTTVPERVGCISPPREAPEELLAVYPFGDPHFGMLAWGEETGADYDLRIATDLHYRAIAHLTQQEPRAKHGLVILLGDTFHANDQSNVTPRNKHQLDVDTRFKKIARAVVDVTVRMVDEALAAHESVTVWSVGGNHDPEAAYMLGIALDRHYRNEPRCTVDLHPGKFYFHEFGKTLIASTHGDSCKLEKLPGVMSVDACEQWGRTRHRYWLTGHVHSTERKPFPGVVCETFRTLAAPDAYAATSGYRSGRDAHRIVYHREHGEVARSIVGVDMLRAGMREAV